MISRLIILTALATLVLTGCSFVERTPGGEKVRVLAIDEVKTCRKLSKVSVSVADKLLGIARPPETIEQELQNEARNSAADAGGDTIVAATTAEKGRQSFFIYKCVDPNAG